MFGRTIRAGALASICAAAFACGPYTPPPSFSSDKFPVSVDGQQTPVNWSFAYDQNAGTMTVFFTNTSDQPVAFDYRVSERADNNCTGGPLDFQAVGNAQIPPGQTVQQVINSGAVNTLYACVWNYQIGGGADATAQAPAQPAPPDQPAPPTDQNPAPAPAPTPNQDLCYNYECNGASTGKKCFHNRADYCHSLCAETNCTAVIMCKEECPQG